MGKKGVILDNGKAAQSSMTLYWKAAQKKRTDHDKPKAQPKEENMEDRAEGGAAKWKMHKQKMIAKIYSKPQNEAQKNHDKQKEEEERAQRMMQQQLLQREMNKNKPVSIPGFKGASHLQKKMQFEQVKHGKEDNNQLKFPEGQEAMTEDEIVQMLRQRKAKLQFERQRKKGMQREPREVEQDMLDLEPTKPNLPKKEEPEPEAMPVKEETSLFKSDILQQVEKGEWGKKQEKGPEKEEKSQPQKTVEAIEGPKVRLKFIPRALRPS